MEVKKYLLKALASISMLVYFITVIIIVLFFGWFPAIFFGLITGFLAFKIKSIYEEANMKKNIVEKMNKRKEEGVFIGGKKFNLNKGVLHADSIPGEDPLPKPNLGDLNQLGKVPKPLKKREQKFIKKSKVKVDFNQKKKKINDGQKRKERKGSKK